MGNEGETIPDTLKDATKAFMANRHEYLKWAQQGYRAVGRGALVSYVDIGQKRSFKYATYTELTNVLDDPLIHNTQVETMIQQYDPEKEFVVVVFQENILRALATRIPVDPEGGAS